MEFEQWNHNIHETNVQILKGFKNSIGPHYTLVVAMNVLINNLTQHMI
jgi:hypothetical protein